MFSFKLQQGSPVRGKEKGPSAGLGVSVMTLKCPLGVPGSVSSTNHEVFRKAYWVSQGILGFARHTMLSFLNGNFTSLMRLISHFMYQVFIFFYESSLGEAY